MSSINLKVGKINIDIDELKIAEKELEDLYKLSSKPFKLKVDPGEAKRGFDDVKTYSFNVHSALLSIYGGFFGSIGGSIRHSLSTAIGDRVGFIGDSIQQFKDFGGAVNQFSTFSYASAQKIKALSDEAKHLGIETSKTPKQAAEAAIELTKLGYSASGATKELAGVISLSESTGLQNIGKAASLAGTAYSVFGTGLLREDSRKTSCVRSSCIDNGRLQTPLPLLEWCL